MLMTSKAQAWGLSKTYREKTSQEIMKVNATISQEKN
jgi:hypothetical protein